MSVFDDIYRENRWNGIESRSGPGSGTEATEAVVTELQALVAELGIGSVLDAACGDSFWMPDLPGYVGIDVAPEAIRLARERHPARAYLVGNIVEMWLPAFDLVIFRDVVQHLPLDVGVAAIAALRASGSRWLLASSFVGGQNVDIEAGDAYAPDLTAPPFSIGEPDRLIFDGYPGTRDPRKHLGLWLLTAA